MKHRFRLAAAVLTALLFLTLTGCGSGSNSFTWFVDTIPANLDPQVASAASDVIACENLYSGLVRKDPSGKYEPALCERWEKSSDGLTYTFYLKDGLTYTAAKGNATDYAITAEDFVFAFRRRISSSPSGGCSALPRTPPTLWSFRPLRTAPKYWPGNCRKVPSVFRPAGR